MCLKAFQIIILILYITNGFLALDRRLSVTLNPHCDSCDNSTIIFLHIEAEGEDDVLHHIWDFTAKPSVLLAVTPKRYNLSIQWNDYMLGGENTVQFTPAPYYSTGVVLDKIYEFNDENDTGELNVGGNSSHPITVLDTKYFNWTIKQLLDETGKVVLSVEAENYTDPLSTFKTGTVQIVMTTYGELVHGEMLPHLLLSSNASQMDITLNNLSTQYKNSRFAMQIVTASSDPANSTLNIKAKKTLDDEHSPGVFTIVEVMSDGVEAEKESGAYIQWRPVVYTTSSRDMTNSTESVQYSIQKLSEPTTLLNGSLLFNFYGYKLLEIQASATNVSFGTSGDGFYRKTNFAAWTMLLGYGHPPAESFSMLVTLVLAIGLGLPALLIVVGGVCVVVRRISRNKDDLFLSR